MNQTKFRKKLKKFDRYLDIETFPDGHVAIIDTSLPVARHKIDLGGGASKYHTVYDRVLHLDAHRELGGGVINELNFRRMSRWARKKDFKFHINEQLDRDNRSRESTIDDFNADVKSQMRTIKNLSIDMGRDLCPSH